MIISHLIFFRMSNNPNQLFRKYYFGNTIKVSKSLDPDQAQHYVGPDLGPDCLQRLSANDKGI